MNKRKLLTALLLILLVTISYKYMELRDISESSKPEQPIENSASEIELTGDGEYQTWIKLTVSESKRLIAKGLLKYPPIVEKLKAGTVIITKGTTNTYVAEEFTNRSFGSGPFVLGHILPVKGTIKLDRSTSLNEVIFKNGEEIDQSYTDLLETLQKGDIVLKGANIINYRDREAGLLIGHPTGGTAGNIIPAVAKSGAKIIIPVGLEKESSLNISMLSKITKQNSTDLNKKTPEVWKLEGELFTEIEAIKQFANVSVIPIGSGGIGGAEGATSLLIRGDKIDVEKILELINSIQGEKPFIK